MTVRQQWLVVLAVVALLGAGLAAAVHFLGDELFPVKVGSAAPGFRARPVASDGSEGQEKTLRDYQGQVVLVNVWATWCGPCRDEMPSLELLHQALGPRGLKVVAVSVDDPGQQRNIAAFARRYGLTFEILHDATGAIRTAYQTTGVPETFVVGRDGTIRKKEIGAANWNSEARRAVIASLLDESAP